MCIYSCDLFYQMTLQAPINDNKTSNCFFYAENYHVAIKKKPIAILVAFKLSVIFKE